MKHTQQTKEKLSQIRIKWLLENSDRHPWKNKNKFISKPCEFFKSKLVENGVSFIEEFSPIYNKGYSIDVSIHSKLIGFEINGNQHYNSDKSLKEYYKKRKEEIEKLGWKLYDIHYTKVFDNIFIENIVKFIKNIDEIPDLNFDFFLKEKKLCKDCGKEISKNSKERCLKCHNVSRRTINYEKNLKYKNVVKKEKLEYFCECGKKISKKSKKCSKCYNFHQRKSIRPSKEELIEEVNENGYSFVGRKYGVSDNCIRKWIK